METPPPEWPLSHPLCYLHLHPLHRLLHPHDTGDRRKDWLSSDEEGMSVVMMSLLTLVLVALSSSLLLAMFSSWTKEIATLVPDTHTCIVIVRTDSRSNT